MPYVSDAQRKKFHAMEDRGEISHSTVEHWDKASKGKKLPEHVSKKASAVEQRLLVNSAIKIASRIKKGGAMDLIAQLGSKVAPAISNNVVDPVANLLRTVSKTTPHWTSAAHNPIFAKATQMAGSAAGKALPAAERASDYLGSAALGGLSGNPNAARNVGLGTLGAVGGLGALGLHNRNKEASRIVNIGGRLWETHSPGEPDYAEHMIRQAKIHADRLATGIPPGPNPQDSKAFMDAMSAKTAASIGTPYTDGILSWCLTNGLDANQVLDVFEKGASQEGQTGQECKAFLDRLLAE